MFSVSIARPRKTFTRNNTYGSGSNFDRTNSNYGSNNYNINNVFNNNNNNNNNNHHKIINSNITNSNASINYSSSNNENSLSPMTALQNTGKCVILILIEWDILKRSPDFLNNQQN